MAKKKKTEFHTELGYQTAAEPRTMASGVPVFCSFDELAPTDLVKGNPKNPNRHPDEQLKRLSENISGLGWRAIITISKRSGMVVRGHGRLAAAKLLKLKEVPVEYQDYASDEEEIADLIADNRLSELAEMETTALADLIINMDTGELPLEYTAFSDEEIANIISVINGDGDTTDDQADHIPEVTPKPISRHGDIWEIGTHRLICGDCTNKDTIDKLMQGEIAHCVFTDPPYGVSYTGGVGKDWEQIKDDELTQDDLMIKLLIPAFRNYMGITTDTAAFYIWHASSTRRDFEDALVKVGLLEKQYIIWVKNNIQMGHADYQWQHEPCFYAEKSGQSTPFYGDRKQSTVWKVTMRGKTELSTVLTGGVVITDGMGNKLFTAEKAPKGKKVRYVRISEDKSVFLFQDGKGTTVWEVARETNYQHPTQKPVELAVRALENSTQPGEIVVDFFGGSGTTLIGAELTHRQARLTEIDPTYCDVIIKRYALIAGVNRITCTRDGEQYGFMDLFTEDDSEGGDGK